MNREIKFRIWDKEKKRFLNRKEIHDIGEFYYNGFMGECEKTGECEEYSMQQFTGIKDKNGKEIYEGDIVHEKWNDGINFNEENQVMVWNEKYCAWMMRGIKNWNKKSDKWDSYLGHHEKIKDKFEVIGNLYENPDLLK